MAGALQPRFDRIEPSLRTAYEEFFRKTDPENIGRVDDGESLTGLVQLAERTTHVLRHANPIWDNWDNQWGDRERWRDAYQWHVDVLSDVKQRLASAIGHKRNYYENSLIGKITKFILKLFCLWNRGETHAIVRAEDFLLNWDSRYPIFKSSKGYEGRFFFPLKTAQWVRENCNMAHFFNYDPPNRAIPVVRGVAEFMPRFMVPIRG